LATPLSSMDEADWKKGLLVLGAGFGLLLFLGWLSAPDNIEESTAKSKTRSSKRKRPSAPPSRTKPSSEEYLSKIDQEIAQIGVGMKKLSPSEVRLKEKCRILTGLLESYQLNVDSVEGINETIKEKKKSITSKIQELLVEVDEIERRDNE